MKKWGELHKSIHQLLDAENDGDFDDIVWCRAECLSRGDPELDGYCDSCYPKYGKKSNVFNRVVYWIQSRKYKRI